MLSSQQVSHESSSRCIPSVFWFATMITPRFSFLHSIVIALGIYPLDKSAELLGVAMVL